MEIFRGREGHYGTVGLLTALSAQYAIDLLVEQALDSLAQCNRTGLVRALGWPDPFQCRFVVSMHSRG